MGVFLDLHKAFDTLNRKVLIKKLERYGIMDREFDWFISYFQNRRQFVVYKDEKSQVESVNYGIAQGSIAGPILYIIYMNDIVRCSDKLKFIMYADDTNICVSSPQLEDSINCLNGELEKVSNWLAINSLTLNVSKCHCVIFRRRKQQTRDNVNIKLNNQFPAAAEQYKIPGSNLG